MDTATLPRAELHCHLIGVIDGPMLRKVRDAGQRILVEPSQVLPPSRVNGLAAFRQWLESVGPYRAADWRTYLPILALHLEELVRQNVIYTEITISPTMFAEPIDEALLDFDAFSRQVKCIEAGRLQVEFLLVIPRSLPEESIARDIVLYTQAQRAGLACGVAVAGLDYDLPIARLLPMLRRLKDAGLGIEVHTGEHTPAEEVEAMLDSGLVDRIGHGIQAFGHPHLVDRLARERIHVEFCPTGNLRTGAIADIRELPLRCARDRGLNFSINTDNPGAFGCSLDSELRLAAETFGFQEEDFARLFENAMTSRFAPPRKPARS